MKKFLKFALIFLQVKINLDLDLYRSASERLKEWLDVAIAVTLLIVIANGNGNGNGKQW